MGRVEWDRLSNDDAFASLVAAPKMAGRWSKESSGRWVRRDPWGDVVVVVHRVKRPRLGGEPATASLVTWEVRYRFRSRDYAATDQQGRELADFSLRSRGVRLLEE